MDINVVKSAIMLNGYSNAELNELSEAIRYARSRLSQQVKRSICIGDNVNFSDNRNGTNYTGAVTKIAIKYVTVKTVKGLYRVPANMLTVV
jgi:small-conductance mechanosensitive channel